MADKQPDPPAEPQPEPSGDGNLDARVSTLEEKIDSILGIVSGGGAGHGDAKEPPTAADEIRRQLDERDRQAAAKKAADEREGRLAGVEQKVAELAEKTPVPPVRKITKAIWGSD